jgi:hypothetical protein
MINGVAGERLVTPIRKPIPKLKPIRLGIRQHLLVISLQADDGTRALSLKVKQALHDAPAVWSTVDVVPKENETQIVIAGKVSAGGEESLQLGAAAMDVSDRKGQDRLQLLIGRTVPANLRQHYAACLLSSGCNISKARRKIAATASSSITRASPRHLALTSIRLAEALSLMGNKSSKLSRRSIATHTQSMAKAVIANIVVAPATRTAQGDCWPKHR